MDGFDPRIYYFWFCILVGVVFYLIAYRINVVDIRFLPFLQIFLMLVSAIELGRVVQLFKAQWIITFVFLIVIFLWVDIQSVKVKDWVRWNYSGFEEKKAWPIFSAINQFIQGNPSDPRVVYEHSPSHNRFGSLRAFESIPLFSGRSTLEGIYMQSSISSPFVFYIQSEVSKVSSCPLPDYGCSTLNLEKGIHHLKLFNVRDFIVVSQEVKSSIQRFPEWVLKKRFGQYEIYELTTNENRYVTPLQYEPVLYETENWKTESYRWFKRFESDGVHLVFTDEVTAEHQQRFKVIIRDGMLDALPKVSVNDSCKVMEEIENDRILIKTTCINTPLLIKVSYHPNWKVEGADQVYLISPSFMLVFPNEESVILRFSNGWVERLGFFMSFSGILILFFGIPFLRDSRIARTVVNRMVKTNLMFLNFLYRISLFQWGCDYTHRNRFKVLCFTMLGLGGMFTLFVLQSKIADPNILYKRGMGFFKEENYSETRPLLERIIREYPVTSIAQNASYFNAITYFKENKYSQTIIEFQKLIKNFPESHWVPEAYYHIGLSYSRLKRFDEAKETYQFIINGFPANRWAGHAKSRLKEIVERL